MNSYQTIFALFYTLYSAMAIAISGKTQPFDTPSMFKGYGKSWARFIFSFLILNILPLICFAFAFNALRDDINPSLTIDVALLLFLPSLVGLGFYRIHYGLMLLKNRGGYFFYDKHLYGKTKGLPASFNDDLDARPAHHREPFAHIIPGVLWVILSLLPVLFFMNN